MSAPSLFQMPSEISMLETNWLDISSEAVDQSEWLSQAEPGITQPG